MKMRRFIGLNKISFLVELTYQMKEEKLMTQEELEFRRKRSIASTLKN